MDKAKLKGSCGTRIDRTSIVCRLHKAVSDAAPVAIMSLPVLHLLYGLLQPAHSSVGGFKGKGCILATTSSFSNSTAI